MKFCEQCCDGKNGCIYPMQGLSPHVGYYKRGLPMGNRKELPENEWPSSFVLEDPNEKADGRPRLGIYLRCQNCGAGDDGELMNFIMKASSANDSSKK